MRVNPFSQATDYLWDGESDQCPVTHEQYLCHALLRLRDSQAISIALYGKAIGMIKARLGGYLSVESWLCNEAGLTLSALTQEAVQAYRFLWLKELEQLWNQGERI